MEWQQLISNTRAGKRFSGGSIRSIFEQDYDRVIFSEPFRRLQDKTQVHPLPEYDFVHNRLTHSLEVSSVGRSLGKLVGEAILQRNPAIKDFTSHDIASIVATASLAHDIGNPPFGHSGEAAISNFFSESDLGKEITAGLNEKEQEDLRNFEGNAQGFRLLNKKNYQGLKISYTTLAAFTKYPRPSVIREKDKTRRSQKKFGFYQTETEVYKEIAEELKIAVAGAQQDAWLRHPLTYLVEAADDICYHIIDLEDGCRLGLVSFEEVKNLLVPILGDRYNPSKLENISGVIEKLGMLRALVIGQLIDECVSLFLDEEENIRKGSFDAALADKIPSNGYLADIINVSIKRIYRSEKVLEKEAAGYEILPALTSIFLGAIYYRHQSEKVFSKYRTHYLLLPEDIRDEIEASDELYPKIRAGLDYVSGLTDRNALNLYRKIKGINVSL
ncbi:MAG: dGTP triphosphohydrolase [Candidatus Cyclobacteriaceae bacterium M2_1C_046]